MKYEIILFDSDNTLLNYSKSEKIALSKALKNHGVNPTKKIIAKYREINDTLWKEHEKGLIGKKELGVLRYERLFDFLGKKIPAKTFNDEYMQILSTQNHLIKGAIRLLKRLKEKGLKLYLVTNGTAWIQDSRIGSSPIKEYLSDMFVSEKAGFSKPDKRYFDYCFNLIPDINLANALLVGDSPSADILGAVNAGIDSCHFCPKGKPSPLATYSVKRLVDLLKIIK